MTRAAVAEPGSQTTGADKTGAGKTSAETAGAAAPAVVETKGLSLVFQTADAPVHALDDIDLTIRQGARSAEHTSELQSLMRISYAVFCLKKNINLTKIVYNPHHSNN